MQNTSPGGKAADRTKPRKKPAKSHLGEQSISHSDIVAFNLCELRYRMAKEGAERAEPDEFELVGKITHKVVEKSDTASGDAVAEAEIANVSEEHRSAVEETVATCVEVDRDNVDPDEFDVLTEKLFRWKDPETGWELVAKPDKVSRSYDDRGSEIIKVTDKKTSEYVKRRDVDQIFFFGLVIYLINSDFFGSIKLVVKKLRNKENPFSEYWFSRAKADANLRMVRDVIRRIQKALERNRFKPTTGSHCDGCPFRGECRAYAAWQNGDRSKERDEIMRQKSWRRPPQYGGDRKTA